MQIRVSGGRKEISDNSEEAKKILKKNREEILFGFIFGDGE